MREPAGFRVLRLSTPALEILEQTVLEGNHDT
jgi:hypothetical protein